MFVSEETGVEPMGFFVLTSESNENDDDDDDGGDEDGEIETFDSMTDVERDREVQRSDIDRHSLDVNK